MKWPRIFIVLLLPCLQAMAQKPAALPHGMVFGGKPDTANAMPVSKLKEFMGRKPRIYTVVKGRVVQVTKEKGGWFDIDAGNNKVISAHFTNFDVNLPAAIQDRTVIIQGVAKKNLLSDDHQHFAGDTVTYVTGSDTTRHLISIEVKGLMVYQ